jgi:hypothetical protein
MAKSVAATRALPMRWLHHPPITQPTAPMPIMAKASPDKAPPRKRQAADDDQAGVMSRRHTTPIGGRNSRGRMPGTHGLEKATTRPNRSGGVRHGAFQVRTITEPEDHHGSQQGQAG